MDTFTSKFKCDFICFTFIIFLILLTILTRNLDPMYADNWTNKFVLVV